MSARNWFRMALLSALASVATASMAERYTSADDDDGLAPVISIDAYTPTAATPSDTSKADPLSFVSAETAYYRPSSGSTAVKPASSESSVFSVTASCDSACDAASSESGLWSDHKCGDGCGCCLPWWAHRNGGFGELLYLSAGNSDLIYAIEQTGPVGAPSPTGPIGLSNIEEELGYRAGFSLARSNCSSLFASYTRWDGETTSSLLATGTNVLNSTLIHPSTATTGAASLEATVRQLANFQIVDAGFRHVYRAGDCSVLNWSGGVRYGNLEQGLVGQQTVSVATGLTTVTTDIDFESVGILGGLDGERQCKSNGVLIYGKAIGSLLAGTWKADYTQTNQFNGGVIGNTFEDFRVSPVVDLELGSGWQSAKGTLRITTGYLFNTWFNAIPNRDYIRAVRTSNFLDLDNSITFSGLVFRSELRF